MKKLYRATDVWKKTKIMFIFSTASYKLNYFTILKCNINLENVSSLLAHAEIHSLIRKGLSLPSSDIYIVYVTNVDNYRRISVDTGTKSYCVNKHQSWTQFEIPTNFVQEVMRCFVLFKTDIFKLSEFRFLTCRSLIS